MERGAGRRGGPGAIAGFTLAGLVACTMTTADAPAPAYPPAVPSTQVDVYHGVTVADPYRWLEDPANPATAEWIAAENRLTAEWLGRLPGREYFAGRLRALIDFERVGVPQREQGTYVYAFNPGQAEQDALWVTDDPARPGRVLLDPLALRADGTVSISHWELSPDGRHLAYGLSDGGSDWTTWHLRSVATGADEPDVLVGTKFTGVAWSRDGAGFYYSRYPESAPGRYDDGRQVAIWYHRLGTPQAVDEAIFAIADHPTRDPYPDVTEDGRFLVINVEDGYDTSGLYYQRLGAGRRSGPTVRLLDAWDGLYTFLGNLGDVFYVQTTAGAPRGRIVAIDLAHPEPAAWREVVPESADALDVASLVGGRLVLQYVTDAHARVMVVPAAGSGAPREIRLPGRGTVAGLGGTPDNPETFFTYSDFTTPRALYRLDVTTGDTRLLRAPSAGVDPARYVTEQVFYTSRDGTRVPLYIVRRRDVVPDGQRPTVLYGYGGFSVSLLPTYSASRMAWIEAGGIYAQANLRGGGEYGEAWHLAGTKQNKQNVFDDFIAAAEWLGSHGYTNEKHLAIWGGSNGGLLVGATLNQRPDLFAAAVPAVGVLDMLRYHTASLNARKWSSDYGLSENKAEFAALRAYSPYHNIRAGTCYPAVLVQADANDDRVVGWHSYKYAAALQAAQSQVPGCTRPVLIRIETRAGHGSGASTSKIVGEYADQWAFVARYTGLELPQGSPAP